MHPKLPINGFTLIDSEQRSRDNPQTWGHPDAESLGRIEPGYFVKIGVSQSGFSGERFWGRVIKRVGSDIFIQIDQANLLASSEHGLCDGDIVIVREKNIFGIADSSHSIIWEP